MNNEKTDELRYFLKDSIRLETDFSTTGQNMGIKAPPIEKPCPEQSSKLSLPFPDEWKTIGDISVKNAIARRESCRKYKNTALSIEELAYLLWSTQGVRQIRNNTAFRTVPSAGCRHAFETYIAVFNVEGL